MYLLDTNVVSELRRQRPHGAVLAWMRSVRHEDIFLPAICAGEIQMGIERTRGNDPQKAADLSNWLGAILASSQWIAHGPEVFRLWGTIAEKNPDLFADALIAATAIHHNMTVVTRNIADFARFNVRVFNPFDYAP